METFELANLTDAQAICDLMNKAYRQNAGWTSEYGMVAGNRITIDLVEAKLQANNACFLLHKQNSGLIACICIEVEGTSVQFGHFAVLPSHQGQGLGHRLLAAAEKYALANLPINQFQMWVLTPRADLIAYYQRRGYQLTGKREPFPTDIKVGTPMLDHLTLVELTKIAIQT